MLLTLVSRGVGEDYRRGWGGLQTWGAGLLRRREQDNVEGRTTDRGEWNSGLRERGNTILFGTNQI